jgi:hypothetical protein
LYVVCRLYGLRAISCKEFNSYDDRHGTWRIKSLAEKHVAEKHASQAESTLLERLSQINPKKLFVYRRKYLGSISKIWSSISSLPCGGIFTLLWRRTAAMRIFLVLGLMAMFSKSPTAREEGCPSE